MGWIDFFFEFWTDSHDFCHKIMVIVRIAAIILNQMLVVDEFQKLFCFFLFLLLKVHLIDYIISIDY